MRYRKHSFKELEKACVGLGKEDLERIAKAHKFMLNESTESQKVHQLNTAFILAKLGLDSETISAALVHEILFDQPEKNPEMEKAIGKEITGIAKDIAKLKSVKNKNYGKMKNEMLAKVILGIAQDFRSLFVELASQLDKIRNIKRRTESKETLAELVGQVYAPIAHKLGFYKMEWEMQDLSLKFFKPKEYDKIKAFVGKKREERERFIRTAVKRTEGMLRKHEIKTSVSGRVKSFNGIYKKMLGQEKKFSEISDLNGIRIICDSAEDCYRAMGLIHLNFNALGEYDDYISNPKPNGYRSIHTVFEWKKQKIEAQIRTWEMHRTAEEGIASHWRYKQVSKDKHFDRRLAWVKQLLDWQRKLKKSNKSMRSLKLAFGERDIFALTPKNETVLLHEGSTALDFAFAVHSDLGNKCKNIEVNGKISPFDTVLESGDIVVVHVAPKNQLKRGWLNIVKSEKARNRIKKELGLKGTRRKKTKGKSLSKNLKKTAIAKCCNPLPGEIITGYKTTKRKITIHSAGCPFLALLEDSKKLEIDWGFEHKGEFSSKLKVKAFERPGILIDLLSELEKLGVTINSTETKSEKGNTLKCVFDLQLKNAQQFEKIRKKITSLPAVIETGR